MYDWITEDKPFVVVGTGRSGTTFLTRTIAHARNHGYEKEIMNMPGFLGNTDVDLLLYLRDHASTHCLDGRPRAHKMVTQQFWMHRLYLPFVKFFEARNVQWVIVHRNPLDVLRSDLVVQHTKRWQLTNQEDPRDVEWPVELIPEFHNVQYVVESYRRLEFLQKLISPSDRREVHYEDIPELATTVGYQSASVPMNQHYPAWDEARAGRMLLDEMTRTYDRVGW
jgi:hypothetical protein